MFRSTWLFFVFSLPVWGALTHTHQMVVANRFLNPLSQLRGHFASLAAHGDRGAARAQGLTPTVRNAFFRLEELSYLYSEYPGAGKRFGEWREYSKRCEDLLGQAFFQQEMIALGTTVLAYPPVIGVFEKQGEKAAMAAASHLDDHWIGVLSPKQIDGFSRTLVQDIPWLSYEDDRRYVLKTIATYLTKLHTRLEKGHYDFEQVEEGIHEFRRHLRRVSIWFQGLEGLVSLDTAHCPKKVLLKRAQASGIPQGPFGGITGAESELHPAKISACLYWELSRVVAVLGDIKDLGQARAAFKSALETAKYSKSDRRALLAHWMAQHPRLASLTQAFETEEPSQMAEAVSRDILATGFLQRLSAELRAALAPG